MIREALHSAPGNRHYINRYIRFIEWCSGQTITGYTEKHHIIPRSMFKEHEKASWNIVKLSARQHFIAHVILAKAYGGKHWFAVNMMSHCDENGRRDYRVSSRIYSEMKRNYAEQMSIKNSGEGNPMFGRDRSGELNPRFGAAWTDEEKIAQSQKMVKYYANPDNRLVGERNGMYGKAHTQDAKAQMSANRSGEKSVFYGKPKSDEQKAKQRASMTGRVLTDDHKAKVSAALKGKPKTNGAKLSEARKNMKRVYTETGFICVNKDTLHEYFFRDGKYYNYDVL